MAARILSVLLLVASVADAAPLIPRLRAQGGSCSDVHITGCNTDTQGALETGDCTGSSGTRIDYYTFAGTKGQVIEVMVRPLTAAYKRPSIALFSLLGDQAEPPIVVGGNADAPASGASIFYQLSSTGTWEIAVSSLDLFASGPYVLHVYCYTDDTPAEPQSCVEQYLLCGQTATWSLSADSCRFSDSPRGYAVWWIWAKDGDQLRFEQESFEFKPLAGIYDETGLLASSTATGNTRANITYRVRKTGWYYFTTTSAENNKAGTFNVGLACSGSGCTWPYLPQNVEDITVRRGDHAIVPFDVNALGGFTTTLLDANDQPISTVATATTSITTPPVLRPTEYSLRFENACGEWLTNTFTVSPRATRTRAVRK
jgi:hypothetical protein